jgi:hypothetical protein
MPQEHLFTFRERSENDLGNETQRDQRAWPVARVANSDAFSKSPAIESIALYSLCFLPRIDVTTACPVHKYKEPEKCIHTVPPSFYLTDLPFNMMALAVM